MQKLFGSSNCQKSCARLQKHCLSQRQFVSLRRQH